MLEVVQHAEKQHDVEATHPGRRKVVDVQDPVVDTGTQEFVHLAEARVVPHVDGYDLCPAPFHLETEPAVPRADVEHPLAAEVIRDGKLSQTVPLVLEAVYALDLGPVGKLEAVPPAEGVQPPLPVANAIESVRLRHPASPPLSVGLGRHRTHESCGPR